MENKQTAVQWLEIELNKRYTSVNFDKLFNQAKQMEKEQIKSAFATGDIFGDDFFDGINDIAENYYNETYGK